ncbi:cation diffusion facilitator family transporter [Reichenbachiella agarivorans]|uniref:Cation diffusion facilitator family transporter n=1 Tax=Reichenbachiella agarivorans TaxID=2979464 RepID=A0ABY6CM60_9BACT|nr:cation diffusion facilitator family transporter [Reichenbachiella agarivorans]UXP31592.1 cation diffusion facilitator family transporter [Reichenbachiella agarivorans]
MAHDHSHHHSGKNIKTAFFLNLGFTIFEFIGGFYVNSIAIVSDAVHDLGDSLSLGLSWYLDKKSKQGANAQFSFGYSRFSLLGALINSIVLIAGSVYVVSEAVQRIIHPEPSDADGMIVFGILGVAVNGYAAYKMSHGRTLNEKVLSWHLIEDVLGWAAILIVAIVLKFYQNQYLDPTLSLLITAFILWNVIKRLKETLHVFLQGVPMDVKLEDIEEKLLTVSHVDSVHHSHIWSLDGEHHVFTTHVKLKSINDLHTLLLVKKEIKVALDPCHFGHCTIEVELDGETCRLE